MHPWFTEGTADSKREAKENAALGIRGTAGIEGGEDAIKALDAAIDALPDPAQGEAVSTRVQVRAEPDGQPTRSLTIEVAIYRKGRP